LQRVQLVFGCLCYGFLGKRQLRVQSLLELGCLSPTVGHREPTLLVVLIPRAFGFLLTFCGAGHVMVEITHLSPLLENARVEAPT
jgi:hypothetical protein